MRSASCSNPDAAESLGPSGRKQGHRLALAGAALMAWLIPAGLSLPAGRLAVADGFRELAPGVLTVIPADRSADDALQRGELYEVTKGLAELKWTPKWAPVTATLVERARQREFPRDIWCLEFAFKRPRTIAVTLPGPEGPRVTTVWYLVYRVRNVGGRRVVRAANDPVEAAVEPTEQPIRFLPHFVLETREVLGRDAGLVDYRAYLDRLIPPAVDAIRRREDPARPLLDSASMAAEPIPPGETRWGVATWEGIDPRIDFFSIFVRGLTNAVRWRQRPGSVIGRDDPPGSHTEQALESLRLDFWRPGDGQQGDGEQMRLGFRGMFERFTLGSRLLAALGWPEETVTRPVDGLARLKISWNDPGLQEPAGGERIRSLLPLAHVLGKLAAEPDDDLREAAARYLFGDLGLRGIRELVTAASGPVEARQDAVRRKALAAMDLSPEAFEAQPVGSLALAVRFLEEAPTRAERERRSQACFGEASRRIDFLARAVIYARVLATIDEAGIDSTALAAKDAQAAFELAAETVGALEPDRKSAILAGLFGPSGEKVAAEALAVPEGIDHSWVFRYERGN